jgi:hypothetical protein
MDPHPQHLPGSGEPPQPAPPDSKSKRKWVSPTLTELPRLTDLTLQTGAPIGGGGDPGSGSTVF